MTDVYHVKQQGFPALPLLTRYRGVFLSETVADVQQHWKTKRIRSTRLYRDRETAIGEYKRLVDDLLQKVAEINVALQGVQQSVPCQEVEA